MTVQPPEGITVWKWEDAPDHYKALSKLGGNEDIVAEVSPRTNVTEYALWYQNAKYISKMITGNPHNDCLVIICSTTKRLSVTS